MEKAMLQQLRDARPALVRPVQCDALDIPAYSPSFTSMVDTE